MDIETAFFVLEICMCLKCWKWQQTQWARSAAFVLHSQSINYSRDFIMTSVNFVVNVKMHCMMGSRLARCLWCHQREWHSHNLRPLPLSSVLLFEVWLHYYCHCMYFFCCAILWRKGFPLIGIPLDRNSPIAKNPVQIKSSGYHHTILH